MYIQVLYELVFSNSDICSAFGIFSCHPRELLTLDKSINDVEGMLIVEQGDLINLFSFVEEVIIIFVYWAFGNSTNLLFTNRVCVMNLSILMCSMMVSNLMYSVLGHKL